MAVTPPFEYVGSELALFEKAVNWKRYWSARIAPFVRGDVLEVGAGIGANTGVLARLPHRTYSSLQPDSALARASPTWVPRTEFCSVRWLAWRNILMPFGTLMSSNTSRTIAPRWPARPCVSIRADT